MSGLAVKLERPVGFVDFDRVWVDDRRRCRWGVCDASFVIEPSQTVALVERGDDGASDAIFDLLTGRRLPTRGRVSIDGIDLRDLDRVAHLRALSTEYALDTGERRLHIAGRTTLIAEPTASSLAAADRVVEFEDGFVVWTGPSECAAPSKDTAVDAEALGVAGAA